MLEETVKVNQYWCLEHDVSRGFNKLKAKIYNLIEASISEKTQQEALKGLIKGFANEAYTEVAESMRNDAVDMGLVTKEDITLPQGAEPLEQFTVYGN